MQQQQQDFQARAPLPAGVLIYQGSLAVEERSEEEGGSLSDRVRKRQQLYSSNLEIIRRKLAKIDHVEMEGENDEAKREIEETAGGKGKAKRKSGKKVKKGNKEREEFCVMNNNQDTGDPSSISVEEDGGLSQDQQEEGGSPKEVEGKIYDDEEKKAAGSKAKKRSVKKGGEGGFQCGHCGYLATQKISLDRHLRVHAGKRLVCSDCGKSYKWETDLRRHRERSHSQLTFPCPEPSCDYVGQSQRNLAAHRRSKHSPGPRPELICPVCGRQFSSKSYLEDHLKSKHEEIKEVCPGCGEMFASKGNLQRHIREKHKEGGEIPCSFCGQTFSRKFTRDRHVKTAHPEVEV